jgi:threonine/homoserine/homoserine lactone efflux protein
MLRALVAFAPVAVLLTVTPGAATALVVRSAAVGGRRRALATTIGNSLGVLSWGLFAAMGIAAVVATSAEAFTAVKLVGAAVLVVLGLQSLRGRRGAGGADIPGAAALAPRRGRSPPAAPRCATG